MAVALCSDGPTQEQMQPLHLAAEDMVENECTSHEAAQENSLVSRTLLIVRYAIRS